MRSANVKCFPARIDNLACVNASECLVAGKSAWVGARSPQSSQGAVVTAGAQQGSSQSRAKPAICGWREPRCFRRVVSRARTLRRCLCTDEEGGAWVGSVAGNAKRVELAQIKQPGGGRTTRLQV